MRFPKTIGHEKQKLYFEQVNQAGRLAHAYAFVGEQGIGKTTLALELATEIFGADPSLDVFLLGEEGSIRVEEVRNLLGLLALTPAGKTKVAVLNADALGAESASALLKTLEDPPARSMLILISSNFYGLLPTIASRVQKITFGRVSDEQIITALERFDSATLHKEEILDFARGRIGFALRMAQDEKFFELMKLFAAHFQSLGSPSRLKRLQTASALSELEAAQVEEFMRFCMLGFANLPLSRPQLGRQLSDAWRDLGASVNTRLAFDNLAL